MYFSEPIRFFIKSKILDFADKTKMQFSNSDVIKICEKVAEHENFNVTLRSSGEGALIASNNLETARRAEMNAFFITPKFNSLLAKRFQF